MIPLLGKLRWEGHTLEAILNCIVYLLLKNSGLLHSAAQPAGPRRLLELFILIIRWHSLFILRFQYFLSMAPYLYPVVHRQACLNKALVRWFTQYKTHWQITDFFLVILRTLLQSVFSSCPSLTHFKDLSSFLSIPAQGDQG